MKISRLSINDLLKYDTEEYVKENILNTFSSRKNNNVEDFLHNKAIFFEKSSISTTHLIFDTNDTLLGKNFNLSESEQIKGNFLLSLAFELLLEAKELINAKYVWLECRNSEKLIDFYKKFGFEKIDNFISKDGLAVMMMKLDRKN